MSRENTKVDVIDVPAYYVTKHYLTVFTSALLVYWFFWGFWDHLILMNFDDLGWENNRVGEGLAKVWFIFLWGGGLTLLYQLIRSSVPQRHSGSEVLGKGLWISIHAGFFEELIYRWLIFFTAMVSLRAINWLTFGLVKWFYSEAWVPLANWATFGALEPQLLGNSHWVFGAAIVSASIKFRDEHKYLGLLGWVNAWFGGMVMFYLVFNYGIVTAIIAHILYDAVIFTVEAFATLWRPRRYNPVPHLPGRRTSFSRADR